MKLMVDDTPSVHNNPLFPSNEEDDASDIAEAI
jgi:hypothetical protein